MRIATNLKGVLNNMESLLLATGFESAFVGIGQQFNQQFAVYDREKCIDILMSRDEMTRDDAEEYFEFNVAGAWVGKFTPVYVRTMTIEDAKTEANERTET